jgi:pyruvate/2-oxoglutarate dehydrogenase complex dihydrolipoamide dehydrogenase (E3) component
LDTSGDRPAAVVGDGRRVEAELAFVAIGCVPNTEWLAGSGLDVGPDGLVVDGYLRAGPHVLAVGDVVADPSSGRPRRTSNWSDAVEQAMTAVEVIQHGQQAPYRARPYFWIEHCGHLVKLAGASCDLDASEVVDRPADASGTVLPPRRGEH